MIIYLALITSFIFSSDMCSLCSKPLTDSFYRDNWGNRFHEIHLKESKFCNSCNRIISEGITQGGYILPDSRYICNLCHQSSVVNSTKVKEIQKESIRIMQELGMDINDEFSINLINRDTLLDSLENHGMHSISFQAFTKCTKEKYCTIYILNHLPSILFQSILLHEMTHVWLRKNNVKMSKKEEEGFCSLVSYHFLDNKKSKFSSILINSLHANNDSTYGDGFRIMKEKLNKFGWRKMISDLEQ